MIVIEANPIADFSNLAWCDQSNHMFTLGHFTFDTNNTFLFPYLKVGSWGQLDLYVSPTYVLSSNASYVPSQDINS